MAVLRASCSPPHVPLLRVCSQEGKEALIEALNARLDAPPIPLPTNPEAVKELDYRKVNMAT